MKKIFLPWLCVSVIQTAFSQTPCPPPVSQQMVLNSAWNHPSAYAPGGTAFNDIWGYSVGQQEYAILGGKDSIFIIDISNPQFPIQTSAIFQGDTSTWRDMKVYQHYLYAIADSGPSSNKGVTIYDLSQLPDTVIYVGALNQEFTRGHNIFVDEPNARLYAVGIPGDQDICIYDLSDPANPSLWSCIALDSIVNPDATLLNEYYIHDIFVRNNIAYCSHGYQGYFIWNMEDKNNIELLGALAGSNMGNGYVHSSWNTDDELRAVVATEVGPDPKLYLIDQSNPESMDVLYEWKDPLLACADPTSLSKQIPHNPYIIGDMVFVSHYNDGVQVLKIAEDTLGRVAYYDTYPENNNYSSQWNGAWGVFPFLPSGRIIASDQSHGLHTLSLETCQLEVNSTMSAGPGTLISALNCAADGDTVRIMSALAGKNITIGTSQVAINKHVVLQGDPADDVQIIAQGSGIPFHVGTGGMLEMKGLAIYSFTDTPIIFNEGILKLEDVSMRRAAGAEAVFSSNGQLEIMPESSIIVDEILSLKVPVVKGQSEQKAQRQSRKNHWP